MEFLVITDIIGIISFAISGYLIGIYYRFDILGVVISSFLTALAGGVIRDALVLKIPFAFVKFYPFFTILLTLIVVSFFKVHKIKNIDNYFYYLLSDSIGLVSFSISGSLVAKEANLNLFGFIVLSLVTAVGGGSIRDILANKVPFFMHKDFYAIISVMIGTTIFILDRLDLLSHFAIIFVFVFFLILRLIAYKKQWHLPKIRN